MAARIHRPTVILSAVCAIAATTLGGLQALAASTPVRPHQHFVGLINGSTGRPAPATIRMSCFGPIVPGQTGHPMAGQTVAVKRVPPSAQAGLTGDDARSIGAFFGAPPPGAAASSSSFVDFTTYGQKPIPTSLTLPCGGTGQVTFVPLPLQPTSRSYSVPVSFVGQP